MMPNERVYTIGELADAAGVTPRTIRYYTAEGLLPRPDARGQYALYGEEHLLRLRLIAGLKAAYLPLGEIKARLDQLDLEQLRALLNEQLAQSEPEPASAADYVAQVLQRQVPPRIAEAPARYESADPVAPAPMAILPPAAPVPISLQVPAYGIAAGATAPAPEPLAASASAPASPGLLRRLVPQRRERAEPQSEEEERWRRVALAPGVELHVREPIARGMRERVERLIDMAKHIFSEGGD